MTSSTSERVSTSVGPLLSFSLSPVQQYIEAARTVRDLWTGSYILSWLTAHAVVAAEAHGCELVFPLVKDNPIVKRIRNTAITSDRDALQSCLPNTFVAVVARDRSPDDVVKAIQEAVTQEWKNIACGVRGHLEESWKAIADWDPLHQWDKQIENFWDIRVLALPQMTDDEVEIAAARLGITGTQDQFKLRSEILLRLAGAHKMIRHIPPAGDSRDTRPKCAQSGAHAQMGPLAQSDQDPMETSRIFWEKAVSAAHGRWERMQTKDRFGAPALVKRFAWSYYFWPRLFPSTDFRKSPKRVWDTATIAAADWIVRLGRPESWKGKYLHQHIDEDERDRHWSGQWLHQTSRGDQEDEDACPEASWETIKQAHRSRNEPVPTYYAILALDGDRMGELLRKSNREEQGDISNKLQAFALESVPTTIREYLGEFDLDQPVYAGGDDVLALLPLFMPHRNGNEKEICSVLECVAGINNAFRESGISDDCTASAGLAIVHYSTDLRDALQAARDAEKKAKNDGRDRLAVTVRRRSGEHATCIARWAPRDGSSSHQDEVGLMIRLISEFRNPRVTDRWAYQLRGQMEKLLGGSVHGTKMHISDELPDIIEHLLGGILAQSENAPKGLLDEYWKHLVPRDSDPAKRLQRQINAVLLFQSASFMARGREE